MYLPDAFQLRSLAIPGSSLSRNAGLHSIGSTMVTVFDCNRDCRHMNNSGCPQRLYTFDCIQPTTLRQHILVLIDRIVAVYKLHLCSPELLVLHVRARGSIAACSEGPPLAASDLLLHSRF